MPGTIRVSVLELMELPPQLLNNNTTNNDSGVGGSGGGSNGVSVTVAIGKRQYQTWDRVMVGGRGTNGRHFLNSDLEFAFPLLNFRENLVVRVLDSEGNQICGTDVRTLSVAEKGFWDDLFPLKGGGFIHMKLQFSLNEQERQKIQAMRVAAMERKQGEFLDKKGFTYTPKFAKLQAQTENAFTAAGEGDQEEEYTVGAASFSIQKHSMVEEPTKEEVSRTPADESDNPSPSNGSENSLNVSDVLHIKDSLSSPILNSEHDVILHTSGEICNSPQVAFMDPPSPPSALILLQEDTSIDSSSAKEGVSQTPADKFYNSSPSNGSENSLTVLNEPCIKDSLPLPVVNSEHDVFLHTSGEICDCPQVPFMDPPPPPSASILLHKDTSIVPHPGCLESSLAENISENKYMLTSPSPLLDLAPSLSVVDTTCHTHEAENMEDKHASNVRKMIKAFESTLSQGPKLGVLGPISKSQGSKVEMEGALKGSYIDGVREVMNQGNQHSYEAISDGTFKKEEFLFGFNQNQNFEALDARNKNEQMVMSKDDENYVEMETEVEETHNPHRSLFCGEENTIDLEMADSTYLDSLVLVEERDQREEDCGDMLLNMYEDGTYDGTFEILGIWISPLGERDRRPLCITTGGKQVRNLLQGFGVRIAERNHNQRELWQSCSREAVAECEMLEGPCTVVNNASGACNFRKLPKLLGGLLEQATRVVVMVACGILVLSIQRTKAR